MDITILIPCLNEEETIGKVIDEVREYFKDKKYKYEILVSDNGSIDKSVKICKSKKVRVIETKEKGYGNALRNGINNAKGKFIIMGDADMSYDFRHLDLFIQKLEDGYDLVVGNRFMGGIEKGAMSLSHKIGVKGLSIFANLLFKTNINDYHSGIRGFRKDKIIKINLECSGMEFASEMIIKAKLNNLKIVEVPTKLYKDLRNRKSHLRTIRDGFRHVFLILRLKFEKKIP